MDILKLVSWLPKALLVLFVLLIGAMIFNKSLDYYQPDFSHGFLLGKREAFEGVFKYGLYAHIIAAPLALLIGTFQVMFRYERRWAKAHRWLGIVYALLILCMAAPGGFIMSFYAMGGPLGTLGFAMLSALWFGFTWQAWQLARTGQYAQHRCYMLRSYVLTLSAISLRLLSFAFIHYGNYSGEESYLLVSWLSWVPQLLLLEGWLWLESKRNAPTSVLP